MSRLFFLRRQPAINQYAYLNHMFSRSVRSSKACFSPSFSSNSKVSLLLFSRLSITYKTAATAIKTA